jgi:hypothetical protein
MDQGGGADSDSSEPGLDDDSNPGTGNESDFASDSEGSSELDQDTESNEASKPDDDSDSDNSPDNRAERNILGRSTSQPISGERLIDLPTFKKIIGGLKKRQRRQIHSSAIIFRNPDRSCSVPFGFVRSRMCKKK